MKTRNGKEIRRIMKIAAKLETARLRELLKAAREETKRKEKAPAT